MLRIPRRFPPEGIVLVGHGLAIGAAIGFAFSTREVWGGLLVAAGVAGNHVADMVDGTHARATGQCRNGGELLDHFVDPLSFSYWAIGWSLSIDCLPMGLAAVMILYATALLTSIKAKITGEFALARFGPTEMKATFVVYGLAQAVLAAGVVPGVGAEPVARGFLGFMLAVGVIQLAANLVSGVREVNRSGVAPDSAPWVLDRGEDPSRRSDDPDRFV
jgi:phosphatidylglycerophosphate synthase